MNLILQIFGRSHGRSSYLRILGKGLQLPVNLLSVISKDFEKLVNNSFVDYLEKCGLFFNY